MATSDACVPRKSTIVQNASTANATSMTAQSETRCR